MIPLVRRQIHRLINSSAGRALLAPYVSEPIKSGDFRFYTGGLRVDPVQKLQIRLRRYERLECELVRKHFRRGLNTLDLGASLGVISCEILRCIGSGKFLGAEADPDLCEIARRNVALNFPRANAEVVNAAVVARTNQGKSIAFGRALSGNLGGHVFGTLSGHSSLIDVPTVTLSDLVRRIGGAPFQLACDIEGSEIALFVHDARVFESCEVMVVELHETCFEGRQYTIAEAEHLVERLGLRKRFQEGSVFVFERP